MTLTEQQLQSLKVAATPLMEWLKENCHPHVTTIVDSQRCEVLEGLASVSIKKGPALPMDGRYSTVKEMLAASGASPELIQEALNTP